MGQQEKLTQGSFTVLIISRCPITRGWCSSFSKFCETKRDI